MWKNVCVRAVKVGSRDYMADYQHDFYGWWVGQYRDGEYWVNCTEPTRTREEALEQANRLTKNPGHVLGILKRLGACPSN